MHPAPGSEPTATPPGWYPDPSGAPQQRYWDGSSWTGHAAAPHPLAGPHLQGRSDRGWIPWVIAAVAVVLALIALLFALINRPGRQGQPGQPGQTSRHAAMSVAPGELTAPGTVRLHY